MEFNRIFCKRDCSCLLAIIPQGRIMKTKWNPEMTLTENGKLNGKSRQWARNVAKLCRYPYVEGKVPYKNRGWLPDRVVGDWDSKLNEGFAWDGVSVSL